MFTCCERQNSKDGHLRFLLRSSSNMNPGTAVKGFCRCNESPKSVDLKIRDYTGGPNQLFRSREFSPDGRTRGHEGDSESKKWVIHCFENGEDHVRSEGASMRRK